MKRCSTLVSRLPWISCIREFLLDDCDGDFGERQDWCTDMASDLQDREREHEHGTEFLQQSISTSLLLSLYNTSGNSA